MSNSVENRNSYFFDVCTVFDKNLGETPVELDGNNFEESSGPNLGLGGGYTFKRLSLSARYYTARNVIGGVALPGTSIQDSFKNISLILSIRMSK
jgi:hypothetical protein